VPSLRERGGNQPAAAAVVAVLGRPLSGLGDRGHGALQTRTPLHLWFWAAYLVTTATPGISALQLQRPLGLKRYETSWTMLHKLRRTTVNPEREPLTGVVEVDESIVDGHEPGLRGGRQQGIKALIIVAIEVRGAGSGRIRMQVIDDASADTLCDFVAESIAAGAIVRTDGWSG
jgi:hypothetical protein